jgi:hypothetical protein
VQFRVSRTSIDLSLFLKTITISQLSRGGKSFFLGTWILFIIDITSLDYFSKDLDKKNSGNSVSSVRYFFHLCNPLLGRIVHETATVIHRSVMADILRKNSCLKTLESLKHFYIPCTLWKCNGNFQKV